MPAPSPGNNIMAIVNSASIPIATKPLVLYRRAPEHIQACLNIKIAGLVKLEEIERDVVHARKRPGGRKGKESLVQENRCR
jgi:hypothetical protein